MKIAIIDKHPSVPALTQLDLWKLAMQLTLYSFFSYTGIQDCFILQGHTAELPS